MNAHHDNKAVCRSSSISAFAAAAAVVCALASPLPAFANTVEDSVQPRSQALIMPKAPGKWVEYDVYNVATGTTKLFLHATCPGSTSNTAYSGGALLNDTGQAGMVFLGTGPRIDLSPPDYTTWFWLFSWPGGSAAGSTVTTAVYCGK